MIDRFFSWPIVEIASHTASSSLIATAATTHRALTMYLPIRVAGRPSWRGGCRADGSDAGLMHFLTSSEGYRQLCGMFAYVFLRRTQPTTTKKGRRRIVT